MRSRRLAASPRCSTLHHPFRGPHEICGVTPPGLPSSLSRTAPHPRPCTGINDGVIELQQRKSGDSIAICIRTKIHLPEREAARIRFLIDRWRRMRNAAVSDQPRGIRKLRIVVDGAEVLVAKEPAEDRPAGRSNELLKVSPKISRIIVLLRKSRNRLVMREQYRLLRRILHLVHQPVPLAAEPSVYRRGASSSERSRCSGA